APTLRPLPARRYDTAYWERRQVGWDAYVEIRGNRYSVPAELAGHLVTVGCPWRASSVSTTASSSSPSMSSSRPTAAGSPSPAIMRPSGRGPWMSSAALWPCTRRPAHGTDAPPRADEDGAPARAARWRL